MLLALKFGCIYTIDEGKKKKANKSKEKLPKDKGPCFLPQTQNMYTI
jgi:hypothetical protein